MAVKQLDNYALEWIKLRSLTLAKSINTTTMEALRRALAEGFAEGESIQKLTKRIAGYFTENVKVRSEMVARTETISASNEGALHRYELEGVEKSEFYPSPDACDVCLGIAQNPIKVTKDSHGIIPVHPNCRCTWLPVIESMRSIDPQIEAITKEVDQIKSAISKRPQQKLIRKVVQRNDEGQIEEIFEYHDDAGGV